METTTIEVTTEQRDYLKSMAMGSHKSALQELIDSYESGSDANHDSDISETLEALRRDVDELQHELPRKVAEELR